MVPIPQRNMRTAHASNNDQNRGSGNNCERAHLTSNSIYSAVSRYFIGDIVARSALGQPDVVLRHAPEAVTIPD